MKTEEIDGALERAERALDAGQTLSGTGFWDAVGAARRDPSLADRFADRMAGIDRRAFELGVRFRVPLVAGLLGLLFITALGGVAVFFATTIGYVETFADYFYCPQVYECPPSEIVPIGFLLGTGALILGTHSLTHWLVGRVLGIRFTHVFIGGPKPPRPGVKTDYASYLRASPRSRAVMHASGAVVTKVVPFALIGASVWIYEPWPWVTWVLVAVGVVQIVTDIFLSTKVSDWKKVRRELRAARASTPARSTS